jgi:hypothetical protein
MDGFIDGFIDGFKINYFNLTLLKILNTFSLVNFRMCKFNYVKLKKN